MNEPEFDRYSTDYAALLHDPLREKFAPGSRFFHERKLEVIREFFRWRGADTGSLSWLDVGCGQGDLLRIGAQHFAHVMGCDPSAGMLAACKDFDVRLQLRHDILPVAEDAVDFVTAVCVYHHIPPPERLAFTREALRVLKPGGVFCIIEHNPWNPATQLIVRRTPVDAKAQLLTARSARGLLRHADARVIATEFFLYLPESLYRAAGALERALARIPLGGQYAVFGQKCTRP